MPVSSDLISKQFCQNRVKSAHSFLCVASCESPLVFRNVLNSRRWFLKEKISSRCSGVTDWAGWYFKINDGQNGWCRHQVEVSSSPPRCGAGEPQEVPGEHSGGKLPSGRSLWRGSQWAGAPGVAAPMGGRPQVPPYYTPSNVILISYLAGRIRRRKLTQRKSLMNFLTINVKGNLTV